VKIKLGAKEPTKPGFYVARQRYANGRVDSKPELVEVQWQERHYRDAASGQIETRKELRAATPGWEEWSPLNYFADWSERIEVDL
jgi:hypothetical protein